MAYDGALAERVRRLLADRSGVEERKMMGGICFMVDRKMCCGVKGASVMVRVGSDAYQRALAEPHVRPLEFGGRRPKGFVLVDPEGISTPADLAGWIRTGVEFASQLEPPPRKEASKGRRRRATPDG